MQMGTRFLAADESRAHKNWKQVLVNAGDSATAIALKNSSPTRLIKNEFFAEMDAMDEPGKGPMDFMPVQQKGNERIPDDVDGSRGNYIAGTGSGLINAVKPAGDIVREIMLEAEQSMVQLQSYR